MTQYCVAMQSKDNIFPTLEKKWWSIKLKFYFVHTKCLTVEWDPFLKYTEWKHFEFVIFWTLGNFVAPSFKDKWNIFW